MFHDMASSIEVLAPGVSSFGYLDNLGGGNVPRARRQAHAFRGACS